MPEGVDNEERRDNRAAIPGPREIAPATRSECSLIINSLDKLFQRKHLWLQRRDAETVCTVLQDHENRRLPAIVGPKPVGRRTANLFFEQAIDLRGEEVGIIVILIRINRRRNCHLPTRAATGVDRDRNQLGRSPQHPSCRARQPRKPVQLEGVAQ